MNRYSVLYLLKGRYHHISCQTHEEAGFVLQNVSPTKGRIPVGIYDAKTELFEWEPEQQREYNQSGIDQQGKIGEQIITIAQSLRRRDTNWQLKGSLQRPSFFA